MGVKLYSAKVEGLERLERIPGLLEEAFDDFFEDFLDGLADAVADAAPGGPGGRIGRSIRGDRILPTTGAIRSNHPGAHALDVGAFITPKGGGKALRFADGGFARFARLPKRRFAQRGLRARGRVAAATFHRHFGNLHA